MRAVLTAMTQRPNSSFAMESLQTSRLKRCIKSEGQPYDAGGFSLTFMGMWGCEFIHHREIVDSV
ncbi:hypothetical protein AN642_00220 [Epulopiscium sp. SCG-B10WGA-EpuloA2]|nr:hypothetical protein AN642_00220 [Epulopiscium sp. SCG-B10WGA-EpuloA2]